MKELHDILTNSLSENKGISVIIDRKIPKTNIRIHQSQTMILYGIGTQSEFGFTLYISVDKESKKGQRILGELLKYEILNGFNSFAENRSMTYVADFKKDIDSVIRKTEEILDRLKTFTHETNTKFITYGSDGNYAIE